MPTPIASQRRLAASLAALAIAAFAAAPALAQSNPLTETPGERRAAEQADERPAAAPQDLEEERSVVNPTATEIIRSLAPFADGNPGAPRSYRDVDAGGRKVRVDYGRAVDLTVFFLYASYRLTPEARIQLEPLGRALQSPKLADMRFLVAGHTDAAGGDAYNRRLSLRRALEVKAYLVEAFGIDPVRLVAYGSGERRLKNPANPLSRVNRRVEVAVIDERRSNRRSSWDEDRPRAYRPAAYDDGCGLEQLADPRLRRQLDLDDFGAAPLAVCDDAVDIDDLSYDRRR